MVNIAAHGRRLSPAWLVTAAVLVVSTAVILLARTAAADTPKFNLLFIQTDEQRADTMAAYGNTKIRTSNLDRLAREKLLAQGLDGQPLRTESDWRRLIARYWGLVTQVDRSVGGILDTLDRLGLADRTIVVYTSDHGDMMGSHRLLTKGMMYEESVRVPWLMRVPALKSDSRTIQQPVSHIDLVPTLLDLMGKTIPVNLPGESLVPIMTGQSTAKEPVFIEWPNPLWRTIVSPDGWKLTLRPVGKCQLYHLADDPGERTNLFYTGRHRDVIRRLTSDVLAWQQRVGDTQSLD